MQYYGNVCVNASDWDVVSTNCICGVYFFGEKSAKNTTTKKSAYIVVSKAIKVGTSGYRYYVNAQGVLEAWGLFVERVWLVLEWAKITQKKKIIKIILRKFRTKRNIARKMVYITAIDHHKSKIAVKIGLESRVGNLGRFWPILTRFWLKWTKNEQKMNKTVDFRTVFSIFSIFSIFPFFSNYK